ncbi:MAG: hypothetical protein R6V85_09235 [Polyangia bacterium]
MPDTFELERTEGLEPLMRGARNAAGSCLSVGSQDTVTLLCDEKSTRVGAALLAAAKERGAVVHTFVLERHAPRPADRLPSGVVRSLHDSTVSIYAVHPLDGETPHRIELLDMVIPLRLRHAHMVRITEDAMQQGMLSDYRRVARLNEIMIRKVSAAREIRVTGPKGTDVRVELDPREPWDSSAGVIEPGHWHNLPNGEILTCPERVDGLFVCDGIAPTIRQVDRFEIGMRPLRIEIAEGKLVAISGGPGDLAPQVEKNLIEGKNTDRIGMFAVGTNFDLLMTIGDPIQDLFVPGAYFSFGRSPGTGTYAPRWTSSAQYTFTARQTSLLLDGKAVIEDGRYAPDILASTEDNQR